MSWAFWRRFGHGFRGRTVHWMSSELLSCSMSRFLSPGASIAESSSAMFWHLWTVDESFLNQQHSEHFPRTWTGSSASIPEPGIPRLETD